MNRTEILVFLFLWVVTPAEAFAQVGGSDSVFLPGPHPARESVYIHCDKYIVQTGDSIWWKAYLFDGFQPSGLSTNLYVELFSPTGRLLQQGLYPVIGSLSIGQIGISDTLRSGVYWLRAYTPYQLNVDSTHLFSVPITVVDRRSPIKRAIAVPKYPGGHLISRDSLFPGALPSAKIVLQVDTISIVPGGYNVWSVQLMGGSGYNCSISVTDADRSIEAPNSIAEGLAADPLAYEALGKIKSPGSQFADTSYLTWTGQVLSDKGKPVKGGELLLLMHSDSLKNTRPTLVNIDDKGRFSIRGAFFFDSLSVSYQLNSYPDDPSSKRILLLLDRTPSPDFVTPLNSFRFDTDTAINMDRQGTPDILSPGTRVKELPPVIVKGKVLKELDNRYASGIFSEPAPYSFDLRTDKSVHNIWAYLRKNLPGFMGGTDLGMAPSFNDKPVIFYLDNEPQSLSDLDDHWFEEIAFIKAFPSLWVDATPFMKWKTGFGGFTLAGGAGGLKTPHDSDPPVVCIYTRKGEDIRSGWKGLNSVKLPGYSSIRAWSGSSENGPCLYWQPVETRNEFRIRFHNNHASRYRICIQGSSPDGKVVHYEDLLP
jgi:hypothetical protein